MGPKMKKKKGGKKKTVVLERTSDDVPISDGEPVFESVQSQESAVSVHNTAAPSSTERPDLEDIGNDLAKKKKKHTKKKNKVNEKEEVVLSEDRFEHAYAGDVIEGSHEETEES